MKKIGIFFGTDSGTTRLIAKKIAKKLGPDVADKPLNVNRISVDDLMQYQVLILGTPSYGEGLLPGESTGVEQGSWQEFLPQLESVDLSGKIIALYGLGDQEKYASSFADALITLYNAIKSKGATIIGSWSTEGYVYESSKSIINGKFVGLTIDNHFQGMLTEERLDNWLEQIKSELTESLELLAG